MSGFRWLLCLAVTVGSLSAPVAFAASDETSDLGGAGLGILDQLGSDFGSASSPRGSEISVTAHYTVPGTSTEPGPAVRSGQLSIVVELAPKWHIYSLTQPPGGPRRTEIVLDRSPDFELAGEWSPDRPPRVWELKDIYNVPLEDHAGVVWTAPIRVQPGVDPRTLRIAGRLAGQICMEGGSCIPLSVLKTDFVAAWKPPGNSDGVESDVPTNGADLSSQAAAGAGETGSIPLSPHEGQDSVARTRTSVVAPEYRHPLAHLAWQAWVEPAFVAPGGTIDVVFRAIPDRGYHLYAYGQADPDGVSKATVIGVQLPADWRATRPRPDRPPVANDLLPEVMEYREPVEFRFQIQAPRDVPAEAVNLSGAVGFQTCDESTCDRPAGATWRVVLQIGATSSGRAAIEFADSGYAAAARAEQETAWSTALAPASDKNANSTSSAGPSAAKPKPMVLVPDLLINICYGLLGGLILNLMPCVLPVIGLKVLSFVEQAGQDRWRILWLNVVYSCGMISVFLVLATFAAYANLRWGEQFNSPVFIVAMTSVVFMMALSFLGVWDIPIPGFSSKGTDLASREGLQGAFFKGVITTILATPCSGPLMTSVLFYAVGRPAYVSYAIFGSLGLGMAMPYLLIGVFPKLVQFLPRPGMWMETFKQFMGFMLLAAVVFLFSTLKTQLFVPTLAFLFSLWFGCWWIGRIPVTATGSQRLRGWLGASATAALLGCLSFSLLGHESTIVADDVFLKDQRFQVLAGNKIAWRPYSDDVLQQALAAGKTVMVEFTAKWCVTCKVNLLTAIETAPVRELLQKNQVVPLLADFSDENNAEVKAALERLDSISVPLLAIYPADRPEDPIVLRAQITQSQLVRELKNAGPSRGTTISGDYASNSGG